MKKLLLLITIFSMANLFAEAKNNLCPVLLDQQTESQTTYRQAFWLNVGAGFGQVYRKSSRNLYLFGDASIHYRKSNFVFSGGIQKADSETKEINVRFAALGFSVHDRNSEFVYAFGLARNQYEYNTESEQGTYKSTYYSPMMKAQLLVHTAGGLGIGLAFDANLSDKRSFYMGSLFICLGNWE